MHKSPNHAMFSSFLLKGSKYKQALVVLVLNFSYHQPQHPSGLTKKSIINLKKTFRKWQMDKAIFLFYSSESDIQLDLTSKGIERKCGLRLPTDTLVWQVNFNNK